MKHFKIKSNYSKRQFSFVRNGKSLLFIFLTFFLLSCEKDLEIDLPDSQLVGITVFEDTATANAALADLYAQLRDNTLVTGGSTGLGVFMGLYADELDYYGYPGQPAFNFYNHTVLPTDLGPSFFWKNGYKVIYGANAIIEGLSKSTALTDEQKAPLLGQALFLRAFVHFYLLNLFGDIPYVVSTDYIINSRIHRMVKEKVYSNIISDLIEASTFLDETDLSLEHLYPTRFTAIALLAKVYLFNNQWELARTAANELIESGSFALTGNLDEVFLPASTSTIWQLKPPSGNNTLEAQLFVFESGPPFFVALRDDFMNSFEANDQRRDSWVGEVLDGTTTWFYPNKYKLPFPTESSQEYSVLIRLAEIYLIRAEANAQLADLSAATEDLNRIRQRAGLANTEPTTKEELLNAISKERKHELFAEQGLRWFYLKHSGKASQALTPIKPGWRETDLLLPLPQEELLLNTNLQPQNPGY